MKLLKNFIDKFMIELKNKIYKRSAMDCEDKIRIIKLHLADNPNFDMDFVDSCEEWLMDHDSLSFYQEQGLDNIISGFKINIEE